MDDADFNELLSITAQAKRDLLKSLDSPHVNRANIEVARRQLDAALASAKSGNYQEALRFFSSLQKTLHQSNLLTSEWAEIYVAQAVCCARIGDRGGVRDAWKKAKNLQPDNDKLKEIADKLGLIK